jgi:hypothetical protein
MHDLRYLPEGELIAGLVHELAHQWWGLDVLPGEAWFDEDWLSEGLAKYCEYLWTKDSKGPAEAGKLLKTAAEKIRGRRACLAEVTPFSRGGWGLSRYGGMLTLASLESQAPDLVGLLREFRNGHRGTYVTTQLLVDHLRDAVSEAWLKDHLLTTRTWPGDLVPLAH